MQARSSSCRRQCECVQGQAIGLSCLTLCILPRLLAVRHRSVGYPAIILSDLNHWDIAHLPLANVSGTDANGIYLTDVTSLRVATEYAIAGDGECMKRSIVQTQPVQNANLKKMIIN